MIDSIWVDECCRASVVAPTQEIAAGAPCRQKRSRIFFGIEETVANFAYKARLAEVCEG